MADFPALGFDPAPGDADALADLGRDTDRVARDLVQLEADVRELGVVVAVWCGGAADAFVLASEELPRQLRRAQDSFGAAARAVRQWADQLSGLQSEARAAERDAAEALSRLAAARSAASSLPGRPLTAGPDALSDYLDAVRASAAAVDRAEQALAQARARGRAVQERAESGARRAARAVRAAAEAAPPTPGLLERVGASLVDGVKEVNRTLGDFVREHREVISAVTDLVSTAAFVAGFIPGVGLGAVLVLGGLVLLSTTALAAYTDEKDGWDVALAGVGFGLTGASMKAARAAKLARAQELGGPVQDLPSIFTPGLVMGNREFVLRTVKLQLDYAGAVVGAYDTTKTARERGFLPPQGGVSAQVRSSEPGRRPQAMGVPVVGALRSGR